MTDFEMMVMEKLGEVQQSVADISAKMDMLVGPSGTNGRFSEVIAEVEALKEARQASKGFVAAIGGFGTLLGGAIEHWFFYRK